MSSFWISISGDLEIPILKKSGTFSDVRSRIPNATSPLY